MDDLNLPFFKRALLKRWWLILLIFVVGSAGAFVVSRVIPPIYEAQAKILIESQQIPDSLASTTVTATANERLELIQQRLMTRDNLLDVIDRLNLFVGDDGMSSSEKIQKMRSSTRFTRLRVDTGRRGRGAPIMAFELSFTDENPGRAARVTNEFVTMVLEQNLRARSERAGETLEFFEAEVARLEEMLAKTSAELARFQIENQEALPNSLEYRRSEFGGLRERRFDLRQRRIELEEQQRQLRTALDQGLYLLGDRQTIDARAQKLRSLEAELIEAKAVYADSHPRVRRLETMITEIERSSEAAAAEADAANDEMETLRADAARSELERQLQLVEEELAFTNEEIARTERRAETLEASIQRTPEVALELNALQRRYGDLELRYEDAVRKKAAAETGEKLEVNQQAERFEVIEQAQVPEQPKKPDRGFIAMAGSVASLGLGIALAILIEMLNRTIVTAQELERKLNLRPLVTIPYIETAAERRARFRKYVMFAIAGVVLLSAAVYAVDQLFMPITLIIDRVLERTGILEGIEMIRNRLGF